MQLSVKPKEIEILIDTLEEGRCMIRNQYCACEADEDIVEGEQVVKTIDKYITRLKNGLTRYNTKR